VVETGDRGPAKVVREDESPQPYGRNTMKIGTQASDFQPDRECSARWSSYFAQYVEDVYSVVRDFTVRASGAR